MSNGIPASCRAERSISPSSDQLARFLFASLAWRLWSYHIPPHPHGTSSTLYSEPGPVARLHIAQWPAVSLFYLVALRPPPHRRLRMGKHDRFQSHGYLDSLSPSPPCFCLPSAPDHVRTQTGKHDHQSSRGRHGSQAGPGKGKGAWEDRAGERCASRYGPTTTLAATTATRTPISATSCSVAGPKMSR